MESVISIRKHKTDRHESMYTTKYIFFMGTKLRYGYHCPTKIF